MDRDERAFLKTIGQRIISFYQDREIFKEHLLGVFENFYLDGVYKALPVPEKDAVSEEAAAQRTKYRMARLHMSANIDAVYEYAESPLEILFLCSLLLINIRTSPFFFTVTSPIVADVFLPKPYALHRDVSARRGKRPGPDIQDVVKAFEMLGEFNTIAPAFIKNHFTSIINDETIDFGERFSYVLSGLPASFHISLQPTFQGIFVEERSIRPDMLLWMPNRPDFKLIIECDGYAYHHEKEVFARDRIRDRVLQQHGYQIFRFSGQEMFADPIYRANEFLEHLMTLTERFGAEEEREAEKGRANQHGAKGGRENEARQKIHAKKKPSPQQRKRLRHERGR